MPLERALKIIVLAIKQFTIPSYLYYLTLVRLYRNYRNSNNCIMNECVSCLKQHWLNERWIDKKDGFAKPFMRFTRH